MRKDTTKTKDSVKVFALKIRFPLNETDKAYNKQFQRWLYYNSHEQEPLPESKDGIKRFEFDEDGFITNVSFSKKTKSGFDLLEQDFLNIELKRIDSIDTKNLDLDNQKYIEFLKLFFENKKFNPEQKQIILKNLKNNVDHRLIEDVYDFFKKELVKTGYLTDKELLEYLKLSFYLQEPPKANKRFILKNQPKKGVITNIFYRYYTDLNASTHREKCIDLLGKYFAGYDSKKVRDNFNKNPYKY